MKRPAQRQLLLPLSQLRDVSSDWCGLELVDKGIASD